MSVSSPRRVRAAAGLLTLLLAVVSATHAADCNSNGSDDAADIAGGTSSDCNGNGIPDECEVAVGFVKHAIASGNYPQRIEAADLDGDGDLDVLFSATFDDKILWVENLDGAGTLGTATPISQTIVGPNPVRAADLDGDGDLDVLFGAADAAGWIENLDGSPLFGSDQPLVQGSGEATDVLAADVDGDLDLDVIVALGEADALVWFENLDGEGSFSGAQNVAAAVGDGPRSVAAADLDGDGDLDLVLATRFDNTVRWFENLDGNGSFGATPVVIANGIVAAGAVATADLDADGDTDVVVAAELDDQLVWFENLDGDGDYSGPKFIASLNGPKSVAVHDIDSDGDSDVVSGSFWNDQALWYENVLGSFVAEHPIATFVNGPSWFAVADFDADASPDVFVAESAGGVVSWHENTSTDCNANGVPDACDLDPGPSLDCNANAVPDECEIAGGSAPDCNGNGVPDSCDIDEGTSIDCTADGTPDECEPDCNGNTIADSCDIDQGVSDDCDAGGIPDECEPDCNGNGTRDSCDIDAGDSIDCTSDGIPDECEPDCNGNANADSCDIDQGVSGDCDGDGVPDECGLDCNGNAIPDRCDIDGGTSVDCNDNGVPDSCDVVSTVSADCDDNGVPDECGLSVTFARHDISNPVQFRRPIFMTVADLNGDGLNDLVVGFHGFTHASLAWYANDGQGGFGESVNIATGLGSFLGAAGVADIDGDGDLDAYHKSFTVARWYENLDGSGTFSPGVLISSELGGSTMDAADVDGDGDQDFVVGNGSEFGNSYELAWLENLDGGGTFGTPQVIGPGFTLSSVAAGDIDGDGDLDIAAAFSNDDTIKWFENDGLVFEEHVLANGIESHSISMADVDGDQDPDLLWAGGANQLIWRSNVDGQGTFGPPQDISFQLADPHRIHSVDLDGDGDPDLLATSQSTNRIVWFENLGGHYGILQSLDDDAGIEWPVAAGDIDGDGDPDIVGAGGLENVAWYRNDGDDCNANGILDSCESDCNANGFADDCDIAARRSIDCDGNDAPDECDSACDSCDGDGDGCLDEVDENAGDPFVCGDSDGDGCEDCSTGSYVPESDGPDADGDSICDVGDCAPLDGSAWAESGAATSLIWSPGATDTISWTPPAEAGALALTYDTLRSGAPDDFFGASACLESDATDTESVDATSPNPGQLFYYLIRTENACPGATGSMGTDSTGVLRTGESCGSLFAPTE